MSVAVRLHTRWLKLPAGTEGIVFGYTDNGQPLVDVGDAGRYLIPERVFEYLPAAPQTPSVRAMAIVSDPQEQGAMSRPSLIASEAGTKPPAAHTRRTCSVEGCDRPHLARGWCRKHYEQRRERQTRPMIDPRPESAIASEEPSQTITEIIPGDQLPEETREEHERENCKELESGVSSSLQSTGETFREYSLTPRESANIPATPLDDHLAAAVVSLRAALSVAAVDASQYRLVALTGLIGHVERCVREMPE